MIQRNPRKTSQIKAAVFDFDGTLSTLRCGWEQVMLPLMLDYTSPDMRKVCEQYIDESTGIQTIHQMKWLCEQVQKCGNPRNAPADPWFFKEEYNRRLMESVAVKRDEILAGKRDRRDYIIAGAEEFLQKLCSCGITLYAASGTDEADVKKEAAALGLDRYFQSIHGALPFAEDCSKEKVMEKLLTTSGLSPESILVCGDGKVEIALGCRCGCVTLGIASDEEKRSGINPAKQARLEKAGADCITGDFTELQALSDWLGL